MKGCVALILLSVLVWLSMAEGKDPSAYVAAIWVIAALGGKR